MEPSQKLAIVEDILYRASESIGDITEPVMANFYERSKGGREMFELHARHMKNLEGLMVEQSVYCLMQWFSSPVEIEILLLETVPHHKDTLNIPTKAYKDLLLATADVIASSIPQQNSTELTVWAELGEQLINAVENSD